MILGPPVLPFYPFWGEGSPTKIDYRPSLLELSSSISPVRRRLCDQLDVSKEEFCEGVLQAGL